MKYEAINKVYTEKVREMLEKGYTINTATMSGIQGEIAHTDFTDGTKVYRVMLDRFSGREEGKFLEGLAIIVGVSTDRVIPNSGDYLGATLWNNKLEVLEEIKFYRVGESRRRGYYYGTKEEAERASAIKWGRWRSRSTDEDDKILDSVEIIEIAKRFIKRKTGLTRIKTEDVKVTKRAEGGHYAVQYRNKYWAMN